MGRAYTTHKQTTGKACVCGGISCLGKKKTRHSIPNHETDKAGIAHHANDMKRMEGTQIGCLDSSGLPFRQIEEEGIAAGTAMAGYIGVVPCARIVSKAETQSSSRNDFAATKNSMRRKPLLL